MAWIVKVGTGRAYFLTEEERDHNAWELYYYFHALSPAWDTKAIAAMAGNFWQESTLNPGITNTSNYIALAQYGGNRKTKFINWMTNHGYSSWTDGPGQCAHLEYSRTHNSETEAWYKRYGTTINFTQFAYNEANLTVQELCDAFQFSFERVGNGVPDQTRRNHAETYYQMYTGSPGPGPGPEPPGPTPGQYAPWQILQLNRTKMFWKPGGRRYIGV